MVTDYAAMPGGHSMDRLIAQMVMGWEIHRRLNAWVPAGTESDIPTRIEFSETGTGAFRPSGNLAHTWLLIERMAVLNAGRRCNSYWWNFTAGAFTDPNLGRLCIENPKAIPLETCRAALIAMTP